MNPGSMERLVDKDCLGRWERKRGMSGWLGLERRIRMAFAVGLDNDRGYACE